MWRLVPHHFRLVGDCPSVLSFGLLGDNDSHIASSISKLLEVVLLTTRALPTVC